MANTKKTGVVGIGSRRHLSGIVDIYLQERSVASVKSSIDLEKICVVVKVLKYKIGEIKVGIAIYRLRLLF